MAFNWKAFAASFLDTQTEGIRERKEEAKEFEEEQEELAKQNRKLLRDRTLLANDTAQMAEKAMELGATRDQVIAAMSSGAMGMKTFYEKLLAAANQKGMPTLGAADIEQIIGMPEVFEVNPDYVDMNFKELAKIQYGAMVDPNIKSEKIQTSDSVLAKLFGVDAMSQAKQRLQDRQYMGGMSIADVNELAEQADYDSLFPNLGVNFFDKDFYGPEAASDFLKTITDIKLDAVSGTAAQAYIDNQRNTHIAKLQEGGEFYDEEYASNPENKNLTPSQIEEQAKEYLIATQARNIIRGVVANYGQTGLFDHQPSVDIIKEIMGEEFLNTEMELIRSFNQQEDDDSDTDEPITTTNAPILSTTQTESIDDSQEEPTPDTSEETRTEEESTQTEAPSAEAQKEALLAKTFPKRKDQRGLSGKGEWDRNYEGVVDGNGKVIFAPPRPPEGGEKTREIPITTGLFDFPTGKKKKVTEAEYWDYTYGKTHSTTSGLPLNTDKLLGQ